MARGFGLTVAHSRAVAVVRYFDVVASLTAPTLTGGVNCAAGFPCLMTVSVPASMVGTATVTATVTGPSNSNV